MSDKKQSPLIWQCQCGWVGTAEKMTKDTYCCPDCGEFKNVHVVIFVKTPAALTSLENMS